MAKRRTKKKKKLRFRKISFYIITLLVAALSLSVLAYIVGVLKDRQRQSEETPVVGTLQIHDYNWDNLTLEEDGSASYEDDSFTSMRGIDVSDHNEWIDWDKVKAAGIDFAFIRVGYRGYETGLIHKDSYFDYNMQNAIRAGLKVGVYFFSQAVSIEEAREEADFTLAQIRKYDLDLPVVYDIEKAGQGSGRVDNLSKEVWTQNAVTFLHIVRNSGYTPMVYNSTNLFEKLFEMEYLQEFETWVAQYGVSYPTYPYTFRIWQYSSTGSLDGIDGNVDLDLMFIPKGAE